MAVGAFSAQASALPAFYRCVEDPGGQSARQSGSDLCCVRQSKDIQMLLGSEL